MNEADAQYEEWVRMANDPRESDETRTACRARMEVFVQQRMKQAFQAARDASSANGC